MSSTQEVGEIFGAGRGPAHAMLRSPTVLIASIGLWGMNIFFYRLFHIDYVKVFKHDILKIEAAELKQQLESGSNDDGLESAGADTLDGTTSSKAPSKPSSKGSKGGKSGSSGVASGTSASKRHVIAPSVSDIRESEESTIMLSSAAVEEEEPDDAAVTWTRLVGLSMVMLLLLHATYFWWLDFLHGGTIGAVLFFYAFAVIAIALPFPGTRWLRKGTMITLFRTWELINPRCFCLTLPDNVAPRPIPFVDVFYADAMCSLSKVFFDWGYLFHMATHYPNPVPKAAHNILIPSACAAVPYLIRARQCLIMYTVGRVQKDKGRFNHLWNALKYSTSIFPLCLSAFQKTLPKEQGDELEVFLIFLLVVNSLYALYWDIVMDWGMMQANPIQVVVCGPPSSPQKLPLRRSNWISSILRPQLRFGVPMSAMIFGIDCVLRFAWTMRFSRLLKGDAFVLLTQFLEVFRRALWNLLRVEWENLKHMKALSASGGSSKDLLASAGLGSGVSAPSSSGGLIRTNSSGIVKGSDVGEEELVTLLQTPGKLNVL